MPPLKQTYGSLNPLLNTPKVTTPAVSGVPVNQPTRPVATTPTVTAPVNTRQSQIDAITAQANAIKDQIPTATGLTPSTTYGADLAVDSATSPLDTALMDEINRNRTIRDSVVSDEKIYNQKLKQYQAQIDAVNQIYREKINQSRIEGQGKLGTGRAIQGRSGLLGSDFASAQNDTITQGNNDILSGIQAEQNAAIQTILGLARKDATDEATAKRKAKEEGSANYLKFLGEQETRKSGRLDNFIKSIGETDLSKVSPTNLAEVAKSYGISVDTLKTRVKEAQDAQKSAAAEADLKSRKGEADIAKIEADIASGKLITIGEGTTLYNTETGETFKNPKTYAPSSSGTGGGGGIYGQLDYRTANAVIAQGNKFAESPIVKTYNNLISAGNLINGIDKNSTNPADHQAIIYNFAKALDPDSVVREGEYATIQKYSQGLASKYKGQINQAVNGTGFLSPQAIQAIQDATANRVKSYSPQYNNVKTQTAQRINSIAGKDVANQVLLDFEGGYQDPAALSGGLESMSDEELMRLAGQ